MKNTFRCFLKVVLIGIVAGQGFPNRPFVAGPPPPFPYYGNHREFFPANPMAPFPKPHPPPPLMYRDEGLQPPSILYRDDIGIQPGHIFFRNDVIPPGPPLYREEGMQPVPPYYHDKGVQLGPNLCGEGDITLCPPGYHQEYPAIYQMEPGQPDPVPCPSGGENPERPNRVNTTPKPSKCPPSPNDGNSDCDPPLKMKIEPTKENYNTLRTALRMPIEVPASVSQKDSLPPTIIIQETLPLHDSVQQEDTEAHLEDDYSDNNWEDGRYVIPEPTLINYPYQYFEPVRICDNNGKLEPTAASKPCSSDKIIPVLRAPITLLPSRFPPRVEQIIERIQTYFSTYNHQGNQRPTTVSTTTVPTTAPTTSPQPTTQTHPTVLPTVQVTTNQVSKKGGSSGKDDCSDCQDEGNTDKTDCDDCQEKTTAIAVTTVKNRGEAGNKSTDCDDCNDNGARTSKKGDDCDDCNDNGAITRKKGDDCDDCNDNGGQKDNTTNGCDDCNDNGARTSKKGDGCDDCEKE